jgi:hypothetical protein
MKTKSRFLRTPVEPFTVQPDAAAGDLRTSMGGELSLDVVLGHYLPVTFSGGAAWTHDPVNSHAGGAIFGRIGRAF